MGEPERARSHDGGNVPLQDFSRRPVVGLGMPLHRSGRDDLTFRQQVKT